MLWSGLFFVLPVLLVMMIDDGTDLFRVFGFLGLLMGYGLNEQTEKDTL